MDAATQAAQNALEALKAATAAARAAAAKIEKEAADSAAETKQEPAALGEGIAAETAGEAQSAGEKGEYTQITPDGKDKVPQTQRPGGRKRKAAVFLAYNGAGYSGMQFNPGVQTIEGTLEKAMVAAGAIAEENAQQPSRLRWMRAARTDKGVSAIGQVVSLRMHLLPEGVIDRINAALPPQIRVFGYRRVTNGFDARTQCDRRRYEYSLPEWVFDPDLFPNQPGWRPASCPADAAILRDDEEGGGAFQIHLADGTTKRVREGYHLSKPPSRSRFVFDDECCARLAGILSQYEGTHNFHNFSPAVQATQMAAKRHVLSFKCHGVFTIGEGSDAVRWVRTEVIGQSFLLNQIRKLIGLALAVYRGTAPVDAITMATDPNRDFTTPMAPELGLFLCECIYASYNRTFGKHREELAIQDWQAEVDAFKAEWIYPKLVERDAAEGVNYTWMEGLTDKRYLFSKWKFARAVRNEQRPKSKEEKEANMARKKAKHAVVEKLLKEGLPREEALRKADEILAAQSPAPAADGAGEPPAKRAKLDANAVDGEQGEAAQAAAPPEVAAADTDGEGAYVAPALEEEAAAAGPGAMMGDDECAPEEEYADDGDDDDEDGAGRGGERSGGGRGRRGGRGRGGGRGRRGGRGRGR